MEMSFTSSKYRILHKSEERENSIVHKLLVNRIGLTLNKEEFYPRASMLTEKEGESRDFHRVFLVYLLTQYMSVVEVSWLFARLLA